MEEYLDVIDEANEVVGQQPRGIVHRTGLRHRGVHVFLFTPERKLMVQKRSQHTDTFAGVLDCSVSEHLRVGEPYQMAAQRGLVEELGLQDIQLRRLFRFKMNYGPNDNMISEVYEGTYSNQTLKIDPREIENIAFYTLIELEEMLASDEELFTSWFRQLILWFFGKEHYMEIIQENRRAGQ